MNVNSLEKVREKKSYKWIALCFFAVIFGLMFAMALQLLVYIAKIIIILIITHWIKIVIGLVALLFIWKWFFKKRR